MVLSLERLNWRGKVTVMVLLYALPAEEETDTEVLAEDGGVEVFAKEADTVAIIVKPNEAAKTTTLRPMVRDVLRPRRPGTRVVPGGESSRRVWAAGS